MKENHKIILFASSTKLLAVLANYKAPVWQTVINYSIHISFELNEELFKTI